MNPTELAEVLEDIADRIECDYPNSAEDLRALLAALIANRPEAVCPNNCGSLCRNELGCTDE